MNKRSYKFYSTISIKIQHLIYTGCESSKHSEVLLATMKATLFPSSIKLQVFAAVILLLFQVNLIAVGLTTAPILELKEETNHTESQDILTSSQPDLSQPSLLKGIVLTAIIVVSILGG